MPSREYLEELQKEMELNLSNYLPERPNYWGGYMIRPESMEFWQGRPNRLHDRIRYTLNEEFDWVIERLAP